VLRYATRMLGGARRPIPPNYLALLSCALEQALKIDQSLRPFMAEQRENLERLRHQNEVDAALRKAYGATAPITMPPPPALCARAEARQCLKLERALAQSRLVLEKLKSKLGKKTVKKR
jgi:hypothetical protein